MMRIAYYPGCSLETSAKEYGDSTRWVARMLGVELQEIPDWSCCGATSAHSSDHLLSLALPSRNLALAEKEGLDVLTPCAACYNRFRAAEYQVRRDQTLRQEIREILGIDYQAGNHTISVLELLVDRVGLESIAARVTRPLAGMKVACYYGCFLVRPVSITGFDDPENPMSMDRLMKTLGADPVAWYLKAECCGAGLTTTRPEVGLRMAGEILKNALESGADCIVTACPLCHMNLDMRQGQVQRRLPMERSLPVYYITELVAAALGAEPEEVGVQRHFVEAVRYLKELPGEADAAETDRGGSGQA